MDNPPRRYPFAVHRTEYEAPEKFTKQEMNCPQYLEYQFMLHRMKNDSSLPFTQRTIAHFQVERVSEFYYGKCVKK